MTKRVVRTMCQHRLLEQLRAAEVAVVLLAPGMVTAVRKPNTVSQTRASGLVQKMGTTALWFAPTCTSCAKPAALTRHVFHAGCLCCGGVVCVGDEGALTVCDLWFCSGVPPTHPTSRAFMLASKRQAGQSASMSKASEAHLDALVVSIERHMYSNRDKAAGRVRWLFWVFFCWVARGDAAQLLCCCRRCLTSACCVYVHVSGACVSVSVCGDRPRTWMPAMIHCAHECSRL